VADAGTRAFATFLTRVTRPAPICVVATYCPDEVGRGHPFAADLAAIDEAPRPPERLVVGPLGRDELADLVTEIEGSRPTAANLLLVAERSGGVPLLVEEVLAARRELAGSPPGGTLDEIVAARLGRRSPECRRVLRLLAVADGPMERGLLARFAAEEERRAGRSAPRSVVVPRRQGGPTTGELDVGLAEARAHGWIVEDDEAVAVRHPLVARAILTDLLPATLRRLRLALASLLEGEAPGDAARLYLTAHEPEAARRVALVAADRAEAADAPGDALAALELAIELAPAEDGRDARQALGRLLVRASDAAWAAGRIGRAVAYLEAAVGRFDSSQRVEVGLLRARLGRFRRLVGDHQGAVVEHRRAVETIPETAAHARALALAGLAQALMLDGFFGEAQEAARNAIAIARRAGTESRWVEGHATCTLGICAAWGAEPAAALPLLERAREIARQEGRLDDWFRATANLTTALELLGRRDEAIQLALDGIDEAHRLGLDAVYGNALRGNVAESLFLAGRWQEARAMSEAALAWSLGPEAFADAAISLATVQVESASDAATARLLGRLLLELRSMPDPQSIIPASRAVASFARWRNDVADAERAAELGWQAARRGEDWVSLARMAATMLEVQAAAGLEARQQGDFPRLAAARERGRAVLAAAEAAVAGAKAPADAPPRQAAEAHLAVARAHWARLDGRDDPVLWEAVARRWEVLGDPYARAKALWRQAEAAMVAHDDARVARRAARHPLREAVRLARELGAAPLLGRLAELARRALISIPEMDVALEAPVAVPVVAVASEEARVPPAGGLTAGTAGGSPSLPASSAGPRGGSIPSPRVAGTGPTGGAGAGSPAVSGDGEREALVQAFAGRPRRGDLFGLSPREREVLVLITEGLTNREIGERLFISEKTVGIHVGRILDKLGVSGRVEAAMVAVRLGLVDNGGRAGGRQRRSS
jgi:DNA-binding CsgD family transcriptional regulator/tetratricopeptide (TPR) repeat protein